MSEHWVPEDDTLTGGRPAVDDDTEGHVARQDQEPGIKSGEHADYRAAQNDDDTEGHLRVADKAAVTSDALDDEDDTEGHIKG